MALNNFSWIIPDHLAGSDIPGHGSIELDSLTNDIEELSRMGINCLVSLQMPHDNIEIICNRYKIEWRHFPVPDFGIPKNSNDFNALVNDIVLKLKNNECICVHCHAGIGRTGMVLSCIVGRFFAIDGRMAISTVRQVRKAIDTEEQEQFVISFLGEYEH